MKIARGNGGFTILEIMITLVISAVIMTAVIGLFQTQVATFHTQESITDIQMSGTLVISKLAQEVRLAGFGIPKNTADGTTTSIVAYTNNDNAAGNTDSVTIRYCSGAYGYYYGATPVSPNKTLALSGTGFAVGDTVQVLNLRRENMFPADNVTVTGISGSNVTLSKGLYESAVPSNLGAFVGAGMVDIRYDVVGAGTDNAHLRRTVTPVVGGSASNEIVAYGVQDLQLSYGIDQNMDGNVTYTGTPTNAQLPRIVAVRISIILRSDKAGGPTAITVQAEDGSSRGGDGRRWRLFSTTARMRNAMAI